MDSADPKKVQRWAVRGEEDGEGVLLLQGTKYETILSATRVDYAYNMNCKCKLDKELK